PELSNSRKLLTLLDILLTLAESEDFEYMTQRNYAYGHSNDEERMKRIHQFVYKHFMEKISISDLAEIANMTEAAFCRYFKSRTLKTFSHFLNEIRIAYSCKLLQEKNNSVTDVCFASGFGSLPYFSRKFKSITKMSPQQYQGWKQEVIRKN
ncbi:MAG: AraC family transcriptional regulator, partial [Bacteroidota bacterium]|nr:AraC family transcriptional regulator [Bacteroidota bacterium]